MPAPHVPTPSLTPSTPTNPSSTAPNTQAYFMPPAIPSRHPMSIKSLLRHDTPETPPRATNTSHSEAGHATESGRQISSPEITTSPLNIDTTLPVVTTSFSSNRMSSESLLSNNPWEIPPKSTNTSSSEAGLAAKAPSQVSTPVPTTSPNNDDPASPVDTAPTTASRNKGKGKDPGLYNVNDTKAANTTEDADRPDGPRFEYHHAALSLLQLKFQAAWSLLRLRYSDKFLAAVSILADLLHVSDIITDSEKFLAAVLTLSNLRYADTEDEEGPPLSTARQIHFRLDHADGESVLFSAHEGNAVFALLSRLDRQEFNRVREKFQGEKFDRVREEFKYAKFDREKTVEVADATTTANVQLPGAISRHISPKPPRLSRTTIERLEKEKREWRSVSEDRRAAETERLARPEPIPAEWGYATESNVRGDGNGDGRKGGGRYVDELSGWVFERREG